MKKHLSPIICLIFATYPFGCNPTPTPMPTFRSASKQQRLSSSLRKLMRYVHVYFTKVARMRTRKVTGTGTPTHTRAHAHAHAHTPPQPHCHHHHQVFFFCGLLWCVSAPIWIGHAICYGLYSDSWGKRLSNSPPYYDPDTQLEGCSPDYPRWVLT